PNWSETERRQVVHVTSLLPRLPQPLYVDFIRHPPIEVSTSLYVARVQVAMVLHHERITLPRLALAGCKAQYGHASSILERQDAILQRPGTHCPQVVLIDRLQRRMLR